MKARAAVKLEAGSGVEVHTVEVDEPAEGQVRVKLHACGLCHTDQSLLDGTLPFTGPVVMGHEGAGVVDAVGSGVSSLAVGDHVIMTCTAFCGRCPYCIEGQYSQCESMPLAGVGTGPPPFHLGEVDLMPFASAGCLSEYTVIGERSAVKIDADVPLTSAALLGCSVATGVGAVVNTAAVRPGTTCAVWGAGGVGLNVMQGCSIAGALTIIAVDTRAPKLDLARELGATEVVDASAGDPVSAVLQLTDGRGVDYSFEAIGDPRTMEQAFLAARRGGTCTILGVGRFDQSFALPAGLMAIQEKTLKGSFYGGGASHRDYPRLLRWYREGKLKLDPLITTTYPLDDVKQAFDDMTAGKNARGVVLF